MPCLLFTPTQTQEIKELSKTLSVNDLSEQFGCSQGTIYNVLNQGRTGKKHAKLTAPMKADILKLWGLGKHTQIEIGAIHGIHNSSVCQVVKGHIKGSTVDTLSDDAMREKRAIKTHCLRCGDEDVITVNRYKWAGGPTWFRHCPGGCVVKVG